jgi:oxygen-independent coproporphyrinogen III oxidase
MAGIYIHIPFCHQACHYCDFHFSTNLSLLDDLTKAIADELVMQRQYLGDPVQSIYFGGGTPSVLTPRSIEHLLAVMRNNYPLDADLEVTLEANPEDLTREYSRAIHSAGINRLSVGIQSFHEDTLKLLNRNHTSTSALESVHAAREAGFGNISIDLIYAIPGRESQWKSDLETALSLNVEHLSAYSLTIEEKTVFGKWHARGRFTPANEDVSAKEFELLIDMMEAAGYEQYEISNFAKPGLYSRHNSSYWKQVSYLGVGPSAHSYNLTSRQFNIANNHLYLKSIREGKIPSTLEKLTREDQVNDYLLTTLRTKWGSNLAKLKKDLSFDLVDIHGDYIRRLLGDGYAVIQNDHLILTRKGKFVADKISSDLFYTAGQ